MTTHGTTPTHSRNRTEVSVSNADHFKETLPKLKRGDHIIYHTGYLFHDRSQAFGQSLRERIGKVARAAWKASEEGTVCLVQKRLRPHVFQYHAVKR